MSLFTFTTPPAGARLRLGLDPEPATGMLTTRSAEADMATWDRFHGHLALLQGPTRKLLDHEVPTSEKRLDSSVRSTRSPVVRSRNFTSEASVLCLCI
jgi:hypothetical protein